MFEAVILAIPGAKNARHARDNALAADLPALDESTMARLSEIYNTSIRPQVHQRW
jgi:aryl-alcohol dehydrogenase-like predicted oxidoreductase